MKDLKICVADEAESKEAQELFFELGAKWRSQINREEAAYVINTEYLSIILHGSDMSLNWNTIEQFNSLSYYKEITLQELRDMVNPMKEYLEPSNNYSLIKAHRKEGNDWIEVPEGADCARSTSDGLEFYKDNLNLFFSISGDCWKNTISSRGALSQNIVWKRHTQPEELPFMDSLNDQYAEIEQVRKHRHYFKDVSNIAEIDVYTVLKLFEVADPCLQHIVKKALCAGKRGHKDMMEDLQNIVDTAIRAVELNS